MLTEKLINTGEVTLNYAEGPKSGPPLVLLPGLSHRWQTWDIVIPELTSSWNVYALDQRGHGKSGYGEQYRVVDYTRDIVAFLHQLGEPVVLVGHSLGGLVALDAASAYPEGVRAVVSVDPGLFLRNTSFSDYPERKEEAVWLCETLKNNPDYDVLIECFREFSPGSSEEEAIAFADKHHRLAVGVVDALLNDKLYVDLHFAESLKKIQCPTLILQGDWSNGGAMRQEDADFVRENLPTATIVFIPNGGHVYPMESAEVILQHMNAFLASV
jgi:pimeloyl-ACP methyl ester carboxylesterase